MKRDLKRRLRAWVEAQPADQPLWPGGWADGGHGAEMIKDDLEDARQAWLQAAPDEQTRRQRERSDRLTYVNAAGRVFDFHALRTLFATRLARAGVHPRVAQRLMRHSEINLTMQVYTRLELIDLQAGVEALPDAPSPIAPGEQKNLAATGTEGKGADFVSPLFHQTDAPSLHLVSQPEGEGAVNDQGDALPQPLASSPVVTSRRRMSPVPKVGLEPTRPCGHQILSLTRLPFRHFGSWV